MIKKIYSKENYKIGKWSGGETRELAIYPERADYLSRDFLWRLSSASSNLEESSFTKLPDFDRILMVLDGQVVLAHGEERTVSLKPYEQDTFDGAVKTKCFGSLRLDYNLIMRKGCQGRMELIEVKSEAKALELTDRGQGSCACIGIYCAEGYAVVSVDGDTQMVKEDCQLVIDCEPDDAPKISIMGEGRCIFTEVIFEKQESFMADFEGSGDMEGAGGGSNFMAAFKLSFTNTKWATAMQKYKGTGMLYSPELEKKLRYIDKTMIPLLVWFVGLMLCMIPIAKGGSSALALGLAIGFTAADVLILTPLIYLCLLPKPLTAHMKHVSKLNSYEKKLFDEQKSYDPERENLMYKYRDRSGEEYSSMKDFFGKLNKK